MSKDLIIRSSSAEFLIFEQDKLYKSDFDLLLEESKESDSDDCL